jgi:hypothetical protein
MDDEKILQKLDKLAEIGIKQEVNLARLTVTVEEHTKRSNLLEEAQKDLHAEIEPIKKHVAMVSGALKLIGLLGVIATIVMAIVETLQFVSHYLHH